MRDLPPPISLPPAEPVEVEATYLAAVGLANGHEPELLPYQRQMVEELGKNAPSYFGLLLDRGTVEGLVRTLCEAFGDQLLEISHIEIRCGDDERYRDLVERRLVDQIRRAAAERHLGMLQEIELTWGPYPGAPGGRRLLATTYARPLPRSA